MKNDFGKFILVLSALTLTIQPGFTAPDLCKQIAGPWVYFPGNRAIFTSAGQVSAPDKGQAGTWKCIDPVLGRIQVNWTVNLQMTDSLTLSTDGSRMTGRNSLGFPLSVTRSGSGNAIIKDGPATGSNPNRAPRSGASGQSWGAIAVVWNLQGEFAGGVAGDFASKEEAERGALVKCSESARIMGLNQYMIAGCEVVHSFNEGCAYLATGADYSANRVRYYIASSSSQALNLCKRSGMEECAISGGDCAGRR